ncbi:MAG TPA: hypothetical protein VHP33_33190 [Polyangiaceae bacterium]|nr:hypothetical protein [Polyangiaceae bacterium]
MQHFSGEIEGFYVGEPDERGFARLSAKAQHFRLRVYRAVVRRVQLLETPPAPVTPQGEPSAQAAVDLSPVHVAPDTFRQATLADARLTPLRTHGGWFEGPIHDLRISEFRSTHQKRSGGRVYGRFVGRVTAHFELPAPPLPARAEALLAELSAPEPEPDVEPSEAAAQAPTAAGSSAPAAAEAKPPETDGSGNELDAEPELPAKPAARPAKKQTESQVPLFLLVAAFAIAIFALCTPSRAVIWLVFLLPTLLLRRILRGALDPSTGTRAFGAISVAAQLACVGFLGVGWWASGCKDLAFLPVAGLVLGVFVTSILPSNVPLLVNGAALGLVLTGWCSAFGARCQEPTRPKAQENRPSAHDPGVPRTNPDGSWPRHPPRAPLPARPEQKLP